MFRGCIFCKMKEAVFGCIGGRTDISEKLPPSGSDSCDSHQQTTLKSSYIGFDDSGDGDEIGFGDLSYQRNQRRNRNGQNKVKRHARFFELDPLNQQRQLVQHARSEQVTTQGQQSTSPKNQFKLKGSSIPTQIPKKEHKITDRNLIQDPRVHDQARLSSVNELHRLGQGQGRPRSLLPTKRAGQQRQSKLHLPQSSTCHGNSSGLLSPKPCSLQESEPFLPYSPKASTSQEARAGLYFPVQHIGPKKPARLISPKQRVGLDSQTKRTHPMTSECRKEQDPGSRVGTRLELSSPSSQESYQVHDSQRQYERDLQRRYFDRQPVAEFLYRDSQAVRGILKQPKYMEQPDIDLFEMSKETERSKEAFMDMLTTRYPQYAEKISSTASEDGFPVRGRSRDPRRRATTVVYTQQNRSTDYDDIGTMSEVDAPTFQRGGYVRSSLPARSPQPYVEKPIGLVFLVYGNETKKALLPNEITHLDTVRALFVRSFPGKLTMEYLDSPKNKIYILDPRTNIYYQLEDLKDIKDRTVLKIHKCDSTEPQKTYDKPEVRGRTIQTPTLPLEYHGVSTPATAITGQVQRAKTLPASMQSPYFIYEEAPPPKPVYDRSRSLTPDPSHVSYAQNPIYGRMGVSPERTSGAPERQGLRTIPENRQMMNGYPAQNNYVNDVDLYQQTHGGPQGPRRGTGQPQYPQHAKSSSPSHHGNQQAPPNRRAFSPSSSQYDYIQVVPAQSAPPGAPPNMYIAKGVPAGTVLSPQRATGPQSTPVPQQQPNWRERSPVGRHSLNFATVPVSIESANGIQRSQSYRVTPDREIYASLPPRSTTPQPVDDNTRVRINKMEAQLAHLAAWVQSAVQTTGSTGALSSNRSTASTASIGSESTSPLVDSASSKLETEASDSIPAKGLTDLGSEGTITQDMKTSILAIKNQADLLRFDLKNLRRLQQINKESIIETVEEAWKKIKKALAAVPGAEKAIIRQERASLDETYQQYMEDKNRAERELIDLEASVEELRNDVLSRQCRVNMSDVEGMALVLSNVAKRVGDLKNRFPALQERMKLIMAGEMEIVVKEEKFLKEEPEKLENCLKKCKKLTGTLFTLKRLASVQEHRPPQMLSLPSKGNIPSEDDKKSLLENIQALIPNHDARLQSLEAADASRQRKKKITTQQEALRFGKTLEMASKALKTATSTATSTHTSTGMITSSPNQSSQGIKVTSSSAVVTSESSSIISFSEPISTSTPKAVTQAFSLPVSSPSPSSISPSKPYPIVSLIRAVSPRRDIKRSSLPLTNNVEKMASSVKPCVSKEILDSSSKNQTNTSEAKMSLQTTATNGTSESSKEISDNSVQGLIIKKNMARAAFFSSLSSSNPGSTSSSKNTRDVPSSVSPEEKIGFSPEISPISPNKTSFTQISSITKPSDLKVAPSSSISFHTKPSPSSPTEPKSRSGFTGIPKPSTPTKPKCTALPGDLSKSSSSQLGARPKKVPPPPPPRRSSRHTSVTGSNVSIINGDLGAQSTQSMEDSMKRYTTDSDKEENTVSKSLQETETISKVNSHENKTSVYPSPDIKAPSDSSEELARFSKDVDLGLNGDGQQVEPTLIRETIINGPEAKISNKIVPKDTVVDEAEQKISKCLVSLDQKERHNSLDSTSSSSSMDSQPEVVWLRRESETQPTSNTDNESMPGKKPRPPLPQRRSSLSEKSSFFSKKDQLEESSGLKQNCKDKKSKEKL